MNKFLPAVILVFTGIYFASCNCKATIACSNDALYIRTAGYTLADVDSMLLIAYKADGAFDTVIDTQRVSVSERSFSNDTCLLDWRAVAGQDYKIVFPATGNVFTLTQLQLAGTPMQEIIYDCEKGDADRHCTNQLSSYTVNGQSYPVGNHLYYLAK